VNFSGTNVCGAKLSAVKNLVAEQLVSLKKDDATELPIDFLF
jgi:hypothetical protein